jgi:thiamine transporter
MESKQMKLTRMLCICAVSVAVAFVLSRVVMFRMPMGGSVTLCSMFFIALVGYWYGFRAGIVAGIAFGALRLAFGGYVIHPAQAGLDYIVAYAALGGFAGVFSGRRFGHYGMMLGYLVGVCGVFLSTFTSGIIFFATNAPEGQHYVIYSALYNLTHILPEVIITIAIFSLPQFRNAINVITPKGTVASENTFTKFIESKLTAENMRRAPYFVTALALCVLFFTVPMLHTPERIILVDETKAAQAIAVANDSNPSDVITIIHKMANAKVIVEGVDPDEAKTYELHRTVRSVSIGIIMDGLGLTPDDITIDDTVLDAETQHILETEFELEVVSIISGMVERERVYATTMNVFLNTGLLMGELDTDGVPYLILLYIIPVLLLIFLLSNMSKKVLIVTVGIGILVKTIVIFTLPVTLHLTSYNGIYEISMVNWINISLYILLMFSLVVGKSSTDN